jgi:transcriptional regulator with XRE-family HTH domain
MNVAKESPGEIIRSIREKLKMSQKDFGSALGVSGPYIALIEVDDRKIPSVRVLKKMTELLKGSGIQDANRAPIFEALMKACAETYRNERMKQVDKRTRILYRAVASTE